MEKLTPIEEEKLVSALSKAAVETLKGLSVREPVYAVILTYSVDVNGDLLPWISAGTVRERADFLKNAPQDAADLLWDQNALEYCDPLESLLYDDVALPLFERFQKEAQKALCPADKMTALMLRVCFALKKVDFSKLFPVSDDFAVAAVTEEGGLLVENLSLLLSDHLFSSLLEKGYLPMEEEDPVSAE